MKGLSWLGIVRLGLIQAGLGSIVVLVTSTLNRVMIVELALPAIVPGALVALHYGVQVLRPRLGYGSDLGGRRTPWIIGGMAALALGGTGAAAATALVAAQPVLGVTLAALAFLLVGLGVGAAGTSLLTLVAQRVDPQRRAAAAAILWLMMIFGIVVTATVAGKLLDPFSLVRLVGVVGAVSALALIITALALWGVEGPRAAPSEAPAASPGFMPALREVWAEPQARRFTLFVFASMLAYSTQDLVVEPFAGAVFGLTAGETTRLTGLHHSGLLFGMALVAVSTVVRGGFRNAAMRAWTVGGCVGSAAAILLLAATGLVGTAWSMKAALVALGVANGAFAIAAIGSMMGLASNGRESREGTRMGLWGAAQALAFGAGGLLGTGLSDIARWLVADPASAYAAVFVAEGALFLLAARLAFAVFQNQGDKPERAAARVPDGVAQAS